MNFPEGFFQVSNQEFKNLSQNFFCSLTGKNLCKFFKCAMKDSHYLSSHKNEMQNFINIISESQLNPSNIKTVNQLANEKFLNIQSELQKLLNGTSQIEINTENFPFLVEFANKFNYKDLLIKLFTDRFAALYDSSTKTLTLELSNLEDFEIDMIEKYDVMLTNAGIALRLTIGTFFFADNFEEIIDRFKDSIYEIHINSDKYLLTVFEKSKDLKKLEVLKVEYSGLDTISENIQEFTNLKELQITNSNFKKIADLKDLTNLQIINIDHCINLEKFPKLENLTSLRTINVNKCFIKEFSSLQNLTSLEALEIKNCFTLKNLESIHNLPNLKSLILHLPSLNTLGNIENFTALEVLELRSQHLNPECFNALGNLKNLKILNLHNKHLSEIPNIGDLKNLRSLELSSCPIKQLPSEIGLLKDLEKLTINRCENLKNLPKEIGNLEKLQVLHISESKINELPEEIGKLNNLKKLICFGCNLKTLPNDICKLENLSTLELRQCRQLKELPSDIASLKALTHLDLNECNNLKTLPEGMQELTSLKYLSLVGCCRLTSTPCSFKKLHQLENVDLSGCRLNTQARLEILFALFTDRSTKKFKYSLKNLNTITPLGITFYTIFEAIDANKYKLENADDLVSMGLWINTVRNPNTVQNPEDLEIFKSLISKIFNASIDSFAWMDQCIERVNSQQIKKRLDFLSEFLFKLPPYDSPFMDESLRHAILSIIKINYPSFYNEAVNAFITIYDSNNIDELKNTTISISNSHKKELMKPHLTLINLALTFGNVDKELKNKILHNLNTNFYKDTTKSTLFAETIIHIVKTTLEPKVKEKIFSLLLVPPEMEKNVARGPEFKAKKLEFEKKLIDFRSKQSKYAKEIKALILIGQADSFTDIDQIDKIGTQLQLAFCEKFYIKEKNIESFLELSELPRYPNAFLIYGSTLYDSEERNRLMPVFGELVNNIVENNFLSMKFTSNLHIEKTFNDKPELFKLWQDSIEIKLNNSNYVKIHDHATWENYLLSGTEIESSCQNIQGNPQLCKALLALCIDPKLKMVAVEDRMGKTAGRSLIRILWDSKKEQPAILMEQCYFKGKDKQQLKELIMKGCIEKAKSMNVPLLRVRTDEEKLEKSDYTPYRGKLISYGSPAPYEYVDSGRRGVTNGSYTIGDLEDEQIEIMWQPNQNSV